MQVGTELPAKAGLSSQTTGKGTMTRQQIHGASGLIAVSAMGYL
jgi:hypothetical protein